MMKKITYLLCFLVLFIAGCSEKKAFILKGEINGLLSDTLVVYYQMPEYDIDTIVCKNGVFEYAFTPDTLTMFTLILDGQETLPVYAKKGETVEIKGTTTDFTIKGKGENILMNEIFTLLRKVPEERIMEKVDSLINANPHSFTNLYLIDKYHIRNENPDYTHIEELISRQSGIIKDTPYMMEVQSRIKELTGKNKNQYVHSLPGQDREGNAIQWPTTRDYYILVDLWASWHPESVAEQDSLVNVVKALKKEKFLIYSLSLDLDKKAWLEASDRDTTQWRQVCDFKGWNNSIVKNQDINALPANILLDKNKRIIARNIRGKELIDKVKEFVREDEENEKKRNAKKRKK